MENSTRRRYLRFSLSSTLWLVLAVALAAWGATEHRKRLRLERELSPLLPMLYSGEGPYGDLNIAIRETTSAVSSVDRIYEEWKKSVAPDEKARLQADLEENLRRCLNAADTLSNFAPR